MDDIRSLNNIGSIFRTCDAFKIEKIYLCGITAKPPNRKITKTAIGATESVDWEYYEKIDDLISKLKSSNVKLWAIEQAEGSTSLSDLSIENPVIKHALIFGNEINGVNQNIVNNCDEVLEINRKLDKIKVKSINMIKKHLKPTKENKGGIVSKENFIHPQDP